MEARWQLPAGRGFEAKSRLLSLRLVAAAAVALAAAIRVKRGLVRASILEAWPSSLACRELAAPPGSMLVLVLISAICPSRQLYVAVSISVACFISAFTLTSRYAGASAALLYMCAMPSTMILLGQGLEGISTLLCSAAVISYTAGRYIASAFLLGVSGSFSMLPLLAFPPLIGKLGGRRLTAALAFACGYLCVSSPVWLALPKPAAGYCRRLAELAWRVKPTSLALLPLAAVATAVFSWLASRNGEVEKLCTLSGLMWAPLAPGWEVASILPLAAAWHPRYLLLLLFDGVGVAAQLAKKTLLHAALWHTELLLLAGLLYSHVRR